MLSRRLVRVFGASPGDVAAEREALGRVVGKLQETLGRQLDVTIELVRWETHTWPGFGEDAQDVVNSRIGEYDIFVGIMWKRLGTETRRAASGTVEEFTRAYERWQTHRRPHLMFYFSRAKFFPDGRDEMANLGAVLDFKQALKDKGGLLGEYEGVGDFEEQVHRDLYSEITSYLREESQVDAAEAASETGVFDVPTLADVVPRDTAMDQLRKLCETNPVVAVEGLPGSGKTFLVADSLRLAENAASTLWYDAAAGSTLDDAMSWLASEVELSGMSDLSKAKELVHHLVVADRRLVIDDFHLARPGSFAPLLEAAGRTNRPVRVIVISRAYVDMPASIARAPRHTVSGLNSEEIAAMLALRGLDDAPQRWVRGLETKVAGLPLAVTLFASAVSEFGRDGDELLAGTMMGDDRLKALFNEVLAGLPDEGRRLLRFLSVASGPFDRAVVRMAANRLELQDREHAFESLQRAHLVESYTTSRWTVHQLIAAFSHAALSDPEIERFHSSFGNHYLRLGSEWPNQPLDDEVFAFRVTACRHLQSAGRHRDSQKLLSRLARTAKAHGHYDSFAGLCEVELDDPLRDPWMDYHYAHCCVILGDIAAAINVLGAHPVEVVENSNLRLSQTRLHAEALLGVGQDKHALELLTQAQSSLEHEVSAGVWAQAKGAEARIRLRLSQPAKVAAIATELLGQAQRNRDGLGAAIGFTHMGLARLAQQKPQEAMGSLEEAVERFRVEDHRRGLSWALAGLAQARIAVDGPVEAILPIRESLRIRADMAECSPEYLEFLQRLRSDFPFRETPALVLEETERVGRRLEAERRAFHRQRARN
jgi:hypothetical protein